MGAIGSIIVSFILGLFGLAKKNADTEKVQELTKENKELRAEKARVEIKSKQQEAMREREERLQKAKTPQGKLKVVIDRLRNRRPPSK